MSRTINVYAASVGAKFGTAAENFGDNLMADLLEGLFGLKTNYVEHGAAELLGVGSILDSYYRRKRGASVPFLSRRPWRTLHVWGSGFMDEDSTALWPQRIEFHAVRGPLTAQRVGQPGLPVGDPALLLPLIWPGERDKRFAVGVIPHFATMKAFKERYGNSLPKDWTIIDLLDEPRSVCQAIATCDTIVSSSLHGLIVADAYNVPSMWMVPETSIKGDGFKFREYVAQRGASWGAPLAFEQVLLNGVKDDQLTVSPPNKAIIDGLLSSFPFK